MIMKHRRYIICFILNIFLNGEVFEGYTIFTPYYSNGSTTYLIDNNDNFIKNAPEKIINHEKNKFENYNKDYEKLMLNLRNIKAE